MVSETQNGRHAVTVNELFKSFADRKERVRAVDGISFEVQEGEFYTLLGPSGCGKTTTLRCVAGLERTEGGQIVIDSRIVSSHQPNVFVPPHKRDIGMVFQSYAIWPHMTVFENVAFPLRVSKQRVSRSEITRRVEQALALVQLDGYGGRMATQLSGGQQQRLALARALVREPKLLLLDEPLSNLDAKLREHMRAELRDIQRRLGVTTIYVTHDQIEALAMSNRIALMSEGHIIQEGRPRELYQKPVSQFVASFLGSTNLLEAEVLERAGSMWLLRTPAGQITAACPDGVQPGNKVTVSVRPENLTIHAQAPSTGNVLPGEVEMFMFLGEIAECRVKVGGSTLRTRQHPNVFFAHGEGVHVQIPYEACTVISDEHGVAAPEYREEAVPA
ncbi:MAG TPA: ABC transporter ATP-binding protein [Chloroflexota bacterium]|nr:ABC transporter ATP-binding protein [Chloroflexota bacterium]